MQNDTEMRDATLDSTNTKSVSSNKHMIKATENPSLRSIWRFENILEIKTPCKHSHVGELAPSFWTREKWFAGLSLQWQTQKGGLEPVKHSLGYDNVSTQKQMSLELRI